MVYRTTQPLTRFRRSPIYHWRSRCYSGWLAVVLVGVLSVAPLPLSCSIAEARPLLPAARDLPALAANPISQRTAQIPAAVVDRLRQNLSKQTKIPAAKLKLVQATPKTWSNGCLDLARSDEMCSQALVSGWRVVFTDGTQRWVYRTDKQGLNRRLEPSGR